MTDLKHPEYLIDASQLNEQPGDPNLRILEATVFFRREGEKMLRVSGREEFDAGHIPGAAFADLLEYFSDSTAPYGFTMVSPEQFAEAVGRLGVGNDSRVVCYDRSQGMWATRLWWMFRSMGFDSVSVLNGGFKAWQEGGFAVSTEPAKHPAATFTPRPRPSLFASKEEVRAAIDDGAVCTINALAPEVHRGEVGNYPRKGRIPSSVNVPAAGVFDPASGLLRPAADLQAAFNSVGATSRERVITYCGGGIAATADAFALTLLGHENVAVYDGSLTEWMADEKMPVEVG